MITTVKLSGMEFHAFHGCLEAEKREGNTFRVNVSYDYDAAPAAESDDLAKAVDYSVVYAIVRREMDICSNLLENVAWRIKNAIEAEVPGISKVQVSVAKRNPPVGGPCEWSTITVRDDE